jgi:hypothetical protein
MLARLKCSEGILGVQGVRGGDIHNLHFGVVQQGVVAPVAFGDAVLCAELVGGVLLARADGDHLRVGHIERRLHKPLGDFACAKNAPLDRAYHALHSCCKKWLILSGSPPRPAQTTPAAQSAVQAAPAR